MSIMIWQAEVSGFQGGSVADTQGSAAGLVSYFPYYFNYPCMLDSCNGEDCHDTVNVDIFEHLNIRALNLCRAFV